MLPENPRKATSLEILIAP